MLVVFDLDGFKHYNDVFGHPAGDAALVRLAARLRDAVGLGGRAYRLGGDEFCALLGPADIGWAAQLARCSAALSEEGDGYAIGCSLGAILLPDEAADTTDAMRLADQRMYARKQDGRLSAIRQATDALLCAMAERFPDLGDHSAGVADLAATTAGVLGMNREEVEEVRRAAELHDIGKVAIPETILDKPGPLEPGEWCHIRRHTRRRRADRRLGARARPRRQARPLDPRAPRRRRLPRRPRRGPDPARLADRRGLRRVRRHDAHAVLPRRRSTPSSPSPSCSGVPATSSTRPSSPPSCGRGRTPGRASRARRSLPPRTL